jgi:hypothetical protein
LLRRQRPDRRDPPGEATEGATAAATMRPVPVDRRWDPWGIVVVHCTERAKAPRNSLPRGGGRIIGGGGGVPGRRRARLRQRGRRDCHRDRHCRATRSKGVDEGRMEDDTTVIPLVRQCRDGGERRCGRHRGRRRRFRGDVSVGPVDDLPPPPPPPPSPSDAVREDHVRGNDVDDNRDGLSIVAVVMSGWLRKRARRGTWVRRWFVLDSSGGVHYSRHPPPPPGSWSGSKPPSRQRRANRVVALVGGGAACHPLWTILLVKRGRKKKTKEEEEGMGNGGSGAEFRLVRVMVAASPDRSADSAAVEEEEEEEAAILLASDANETRIGRACGSTLGGV